MEIKEVGDPTYNKCDKSLHQKNCKGISPDCKGHEFNEQAWSQKRAQ
ncbi:MAG: hypothetical protein ACE5RI_09205 [Candidatus Nitrosomaritimum yanchengensis]